MNNSIQTELAFLYSNDARLRVKDASKIVKKTSQNICYFTDILFKNKTLTNPYVLIDYSYANLLLFKVYFKGFQTYEEKEQISKKLKENKCISAIYGLEGMFDLCIEILSPNPSHFNKTMLEIQPILNAYQEYTIVLNIVTHIYSPKTFIENQTTLSSFTSEIIIGGDRLPYEFKSDEIKVIKILSENPLKPLTFLSKKSELHVLTLKKILSSLSIKKIFRGVKYIPSFENLGIQKTRLLISLFPIPNDVKEKISKYLKESLYVSSFSWIIGEWGLECDLFWDNQTSLRKTSNTIRELLRGYIRNQQTLEVRNHYLKTFTPKIFFDVIEKTEFD
jgi:DNA-binding Lrp family transcriptional regulator